MNPVIWTPHNPAGTNLARFARGLPHAPHDMPYAALHRWSLAHPGTFWTDVWRFAEVIGDPADGPASVPGAPPTDAAWFPNAAINFAENLLRPAEADNQLAILFRTELGAERTLTRRELLHQATAFAGFLRGRGVTAGDRVAAVLPNVP